MQELTVILLVTVSCCILYRYSFPDSWKYRLRLSLSGLLFFFHAEKPARYIYPSAKRKQPEKSCSCCYSCINGPDRITRSTCPFEKDIRPSDSGNP